AGEAFFEVAHDPDRPFDVTGGDASVRVLGTTFTVRAEKDAATVTVLEGRVAVSGTAEPDQPSQLTAGERIRISDGSPGVTTRIDPAMAFAWIEGRLIFRDRPLGEVVEELGRYHSGWIVIANNQLRSHAVSGNYRLEDPVTTAAALANAASADVIRVTDYLTILH
ncbi:MAG: FecR domain-containing protein, partial [Pseudomonadota bacterium]